MKIKFVLIASLSMTVLACAGGVAGEEISDSQVDLPEKSQVSSTITDDVKQEQDKAESFIKEGALRKCNLLKSSNLKANCIYEVKLRKAVETNNSELCNSLPDEVKSECVEQAENTDGEN